MHGDVRKRPWRILDRSPVSALLSFDSRDFADVNFPWAFTMRARFEVDDAGLSMEVSLTNESEEPFPCGIGIHPYFPREQTPTTKHVLVRAACDGRFPSERCMPTGPARHDSVSKRLCEMLPIAAGYQMDSLTGYQQRCEIEWPTGSRLVMTSSGNHGQMVFFAPTDERGREMPFFAVEPMTISADGFNMLSRGEPHDHNGVTILTPGETLKTRHRFEMHAV